jgi:sulfite reductase (NADPH) hemoprotein beta-component
MYQYSEFDRSMVQKRVEQFRGQTKRFLAGSLSEEEFRVLRLQNGLYIQRLAPMLRIAIPYGLLSSQQLRALADITDRYDRSYGHFSTRQNLQLNWPKLEEVPDILEDLQRVDMHAIQTSGNCIRNVTSDHLAGTAPDEIADPRPYCELIRQWSTFHPEFAYLPRKFKIAVNASNKSDRAASEVHDIGLNLRKNSDGRIGFKVLVGGGLGRTPMVGAFINDFVPEEHILTYLDAILRIYNLLGRRDNKYKARIKILVKSLGSDGFRLKVEEEWSHQKGGPGTLKAEDIEKMKAFFQSPAYEAYDHKSEVQKMEASCYGQDFYLWYRQNSHEHKVPGYRSVILTLKNGGDAPGDASSDLMRVVADLADSYSHGELRVTHDQNLVLPDVAICDLYSLWQKAAKEGLGLPNRGLITDMICCPGGDFCSLARAKSIPIASQINKRFADLDYIHDIGELDLNISGCMNACGHHHVGHIGILGVDKKGEEFYQVTLGGHGGKGAEIGTRIGAGFKEDEITNVVEKIVHTYLEHRLDQEIFLDTYRRIGIDPFKEKVYANG